MTASNRRASSAESSPSSSTIAAWKTPPRGGPCAADFGKRAGPHPGSRRPARGRVYVRACAVSSETRLSARRVSRRDGRRAPGARPLSDHPARERLTEAAESAGDKVAPVGAQPRWRRGAPRARARRGSRRRLCRCASRATSSGTRRPLRGRKCRDGQRAERVPVRRRAAPTSLRTRWKIAGRSRAMRSISIAAKLRFSSKRRMSSGASCSMSRLPISTKRPYGASTSQLRRSASPGQAVEDDVHALAVGEAMISSAKCRDRESKTCRIPWARRWPASPRRRRWRNLGSDHARHATAAWPTPPEARWMSTCLTFCSRPMSTRP